MPIDPYFSSSYKPLTKAENNLYRDRWQKFQRKTHEEQARTIDALIRKGKELNDSDQWLIKRWEKTITHVKPV